MIRIVNGDLMSASEDIIGHQVNCKGKMNSGVAKAVRSRYPEAFQDYSKTDFSNSELLGTCQLVHCTNKIIANLFGQWGYGYDGKQYTDVFALGSALIKLHMFAHQNDLSIALPYKIGSDRGGADWKQVYGIIEEVFDDYEVTLYKLEV